MQDHQDRADTRRWFIPAPPAEVYAAFGSAQRVARWWGPAGFTNEIHTFEFWPGGRWLLTMYSPQGQAYPNESRFLRLEPGRVFEIEHFSGHHFVLTLTLNPAPGGTEVHWQQVFDTAEHYRSLARFVAQANQENLERLAQEVLANPSAA